MNGAIPSGKASRGQQNAQGVARRRVLMNGLHLPRRRVVHRSGHDHQGPERGMTRDNADPIPPKKQNPARAIGISDKLARTDVGGETCVPSVDAPGPP